MLRRNQSAHRPEKSSDVASVGKKTVIHRNPSSSPTRPVLDVLDNQLEQL